jgi:endogenous inhibitor of DNA gyrase (YacG/DUF329 family)
MAKADSPTKTCTDDGCTRPLRARGLCGTHYNQRHHPGRHRKSAIPCAWCGRICLKRADQRHALRFCSLDCRDTWSRRDRLPVLFVGQVVRPRPVRPEPPRSTRRWVAGNCHRCGKPYVAEDYTNTARFCSVSCSRRVTKHRYRARKHSAYVSNVSPRLIYERDGWICQLCMLPIDRAQVVPAPLAVVLDHVIPLARGGTHEPGNVQCAHFLCNSIKGDGRSVNAA